MRHLELKEAILHEKVREALLFCSKEVKVAVGSAIFELQEGKKLCMPLSRPTPSVAMGVAELRIKSSDGTFRVFYYLKFAKAILILHLFQKKTQRTPQHEIEIARRRLKEMLYEEA